MKKAITLLLVISCLASAFASANMIGGNVGIKFGSTVTGEEVSIAIDESYLDFEIMGTSIFSKDGKSGMAYGITIEKLMSLSAEGFSYPSELLNEYSLNAGAFAQYVRRFSFSDKLLLDVGAGLSVSHIERGTKETDFMARTTFDVLIDANIKYLITKHIALIGSVGIDCPIYIARDFYRLGQPNGGLWSFEFAPYGGVKIGVAYVI